VALAIERREPLVRDSLDRDLAQRADRDRADDRGAVEALAGRGGHVAAPRRDLHLRHRGRVAHAVPELLGHPQGDGGRALRHAVALPDLVVVEALAARRGLLAQVRQQRGALDRLGGQREHVQVAGAHGVECGADVTHPLGHRQAVQPVGVGVRPRVLGVDLAGELAEGLLGGVVAGPVGVAHPREPVADHAAVDEHRGVLARQLREGRLQRQAELGDEAAVGLLEGADDLTAQLHQPAIRQRRLLDAAARTVAGLEHDHVDALARQVPTGREAGQPSSENHDVGQAREPKRRRFAVSRRRGFGGRRLR
jgi:hypothetical protein